MKAKREAKERNSLVHILIKLLSVLRVQQENINKVQSGLFQRNYILQERIEAKQKVIENILIQ